MTYAIRLEFGSSQERKTSMFSSQMDTGRRGTNAGSWKVDWQRKLFLGPDLRQNKNPLADLVLVLLVFLVLHFSATAAPAHYVALPPQPAVNSHQRNPLFQSTSLTISAFARLSELKGCRWGIRNPPPDFDSCTSLLLQKTLFTISHSDS